MEFGRLEPEELNGVDLSLKPDNKQTTAVLEKAGKTKEPFVTIGLAKWGRPDWVNKIYKKGTKAGDYFANYVNHFNSVELNATYHRIPTKEAVTGWANTAPEGFKFSPKFSQLISQSADFGEAKNLTNVFSAVIENFGTKLGHCFLQLPPHFSVAKKAGLEKYLQVLKDFPATVFLEFRHPSWFEGSLEAEEFYRLMEELGIGLVITDTAGRRDVLNQRLTIPHAFVRYVGNRLHETDFKRIDEWAERTKKWMDQGLQSMYFYLHNDNEDGEAYSPELGFYTINRFNKVCGLNIPLPTLLDKARTDLLDI